MKILIINERIINLNFVQTVENQGQDTICINISENLQSSFLRFKNKEERDFVFNHIKKFYINDEKVLDISNDV
jgi:hypothetical protein